MDVEGKRGEKEVLVVHSTGKLQVATWSEYYFHASQWTESTGRGEFRDWKGYSADFDAEIRTQGLSRRWCWLPWTDEMEQSCGEEAAADWAAYQPVDGNTRITLWLAKQNKEEVTSPPHAASASTDSRLSLGLSPTPAAGRGKKRKRN